MKISILGYSSLVKNYTLLKKIKNTEFDVASVSSPLINHIYKS